MRPHLTVIAGLCLLYATAALADLDATCRTAPTPECLLTEAARIVTTLPTDGSKMDLLHDLSRSQFRAGLVAEADATLTQALALLPTAADTDDTASMVGFVAVTLALRGEAQQAVGLTTRIVEPSQRDLALARVVGALAGSGQIIEAEAALGLISTADMTAAGQSFLVEAIIENGDISGAIVAAVRIDDPDELLKMQQRIAGAHARVGDLDAAFATAMALPDALSNLCTTADCTRFGRYRANTGCRRASSRSAGPTTEL